MPSVRTYDGFISPATHITEDAKRICRIVWLNRAISEYAGSVRLNDFYALLVNLNAPMNLQKMAVDFMAQEKDHAILCFRAAQAFGFDGDFDISESQSEMTQTPEKQLLQILLSTFLVGEHIAFKMLVDTVRQIPANNYSQILRSILRDEAAHAKIGARVLGYIRCHNPRWCEYPGDDCVQEQIERTVMWYRTRDVIEPLEVKMFSQPGIRKQMLESGIGDPVRMKSLYFRCLERNFFSDILRESDKLETSRKQYVHK